MYVPAMVSKRSTIELYKTLCISKAGMASLMYMLPKNSVYHTTVFLDISYIMLAI